MSTKYEINVAYRGYHDSVITVDRNGSADISLAHAQSIKRMLAQNMPPAKGWVVTMTEVTTTTTRKGCADA